MYCHAVTAQARTVPIYHGAVNARKDSTPYIGSRHLQSVSASPSLEQLYENGGGSNGVAVVGAGVTAAATTSSSWLCVEASLTFRSAFSFSSDET